MSSSSVAAEYSAAVNGPVILGGFPSHVDLVPSIIFTVVHVLLFLRFTQQLILLRVQHKRFHFALFRLMIYGIIRIVTFILRAVLSQTAIPSIGLIVTASVFLSTGLIFLAFPCITLTRDILLKTHPNLANEVDHKGKPKGILKIPHLLQRLLFVAIILAVAGGSLGASDPSTSNTLRQVGNYFLDVIFLLHLLSLVRIQSRYGLQSGPLALLALATILALVVAIYKTIQIYSSSYTSEINSTVVFYCVFALPEVLCALCFAIPNVPKVYSGIGDMKDPNVDMEALQQQQQGIPVVNHSYTPYNQSSYPPPQYPPQYESK